MQPEKIEGSNIRLGAPGDWNEATDGPCGVLHGRVERAPSGLGYVIVSAWRPDAAELADLNAGAAVELRVHGETHPVVSLIAATAPADPPPFPGMAAEFRDTFLGGRGAPIAPYAVKDADWPVVWRLPDEAFDSDEALFFDKVATLTDDLALRAAVNVWDNCGRILDSHEAIVAGLVAALARLMTPMLPLEGGEAELADRATRLGLDLFGRLKAYRDVHVAGTWRALRPADADV